MKLHTISRNCRCWQLVGVRPSAVKRQWHHHSRH